MILVTKLKYFIYFFILVSYNIALHFSSFNMFRTASTHIKHTHIHFHNEMENPQSKKNPEHIVMMYLTMTMNSSYYCATCVLMKMNKIGWITGSFELASEWHLDPLLLILSFPSSSSLQLLRGRHWIREETSLLSHLSFISIPMPVPGRRHKGRQTVYTREARQLTQENCTHNLCVQFLLFPSPQRRKTRKENESYRRNMAFHWSFIITWMAVLSWSSLVLKTAAFLPEEPVFNIFWFSLNTGPYQLRLVIIPSMSLSPSNVMKSKVPIP